MNYLQTFHETLTHPFNRGHALRTIWRILFWKLNQWTVKLPALITLVNEIRCICYPDSSYGGMVVYSRWPDYEVNSKIIKHLGKRGVFIDVGANIGVMSLIAASQTRGKIIAFEPSSIAHPRLVENIRLNNLQDQIKVEKIVIAENSGSHNFTNEPTSETSHIAVSDGESIKSCSLDDYCTTHKINKIDVLKIDVEGAELQVLKGAKKYLKKHRIKHILIELNYNCSRYGHKNSDALDYLHEMGYKTSPLPNNIEGKIINVHAYI